MANSCEVCGKKTKAGNTYTYRGLLKSKGGVGRRTTGKTKRTFKPNLQKIRVEVNGATRRMTVCTSCISAGKVKKPSIKTKAPVEAAAE